MSDHSGIAQFVGDIMAGTAVLGSLAGYMPEIAAGMAIIYYLVQFYRWLRSEAAHRRHRNQPGVDDDQLSGPAP